MLDCGFNLDRPWFPSVAYSGQTVQSVILQNLDEDHAQDFRGLCDRASVMGLFSNPTVTPAALYWMKDGKMGVGVQHAHDVLTTYGNTHIGSWDHALGGVRWQAFWNKFAQPFTDTNNLSVAVFVNWGGFTMLLGGDMECAGWEQLLQNPLFVARLNEVKVYVASHHGRENGKCAALFRYMHPDLIIFSDGPKRHGTQETRDWYAARVPGIVDNGKPRTASGPAKRHVMTTRSDGTLTIKVAPQGGYTVFYEKSEPTIEEVIAAMFPPQPNALSRLLDHYP
jgi:hypothetical protein